MDRNKDIEKRLPRLTVREQEVRKKIIFSSWNRFKNELIMQEMANIFRMPLSQFFKTFKEISNKVSKKNG